MPSREEKQAIKAEGVNTELSVILAALSLPAMDVRVHSDRRGLTGTKVVIKIKDSEAEAEGPPSAAV